MLLRRGSVFLLLNSEEKDMYKYGTRTDSQSPTDCLPIYLDLHPTLSDDVG